jgi:hypothetical protein
MHDFDKIKSIPALYMLHTAAQCFVNVPAAAGALVRYNDNCCSCALL